MCFDNGHVPSESVNFLPNSSLSCCNNFAFPEYVVNLSEVFQLRDI